jgi:sortase (surface protein transpeptidase)
MRSRSANRRLRRRPSQVLAGAAVAAGVLGLGLSACEPGPTGSPSAPIAAPARQPPTPAAQSPAPPMPKSEPVRIEIPAIGITSEITELGLRPDGSMEVPAAAYPAGWYGGAPTPGELGPAIIAGHLDWKGDPGVFAELHQTEPGDAVTVRRRDGSTALFQVNRVAQIPKDKFPTEAVYGNIDHPGLRLITCGGYFDEQARSYVDNTVVYADLVASTPPDE